MNSNNINITASHTRRSNRYSVSPKKRTALSAPSSSARSRSLAASQDYTGRVNAVHEQLHVLEPAVSPADFYGLDTIAGIQWLQERIFDSIPAPNVRFSRKKYEEISEFQRQVPRVVLQHQLDALFLHGHSDTAREIEYLVEQHQLRRLLIGAGRGPGDARTGDVGLLYEQQYLDRLESSLADVSTINDEAHSAMNKFKSFLATHVDHMLPRSSFSEFSDSEMRFLVENGWTTLVSHDTYALSIPGAGKLTRLLHASRTDVMRFLARQKYKECLEKSFKERKVKIKNEESANLGWTYRFCDLVGSGRIECFNTPVGRAFKGTRKGFQSL